MSSEATHVFLTRLESGLRDRAVVAPYSGRRASWQMILLEAGSLQMLVQSDTETIRQTRLDAPGFVCQPVDRAHQILLGAGSTGVHLSVGERAMTTALGSAPEAVELWRMMAAPQILTLTDRPDDAARIDGAIAAIETELEQRMPGQIMVVEAYLRALMVQLWRNGMSEAVAVSPDGPGTLLLRRFRQLVETHFRSRWRVRDYGDALGISPDRLHSLCTRMLGRTPLELIHARSCREARALLTRSNMSLDQMAAYLGFPSSAQFSAFFRKYEHMPPGRYRAHSARDGRDPAPDVAGFNDWP